MQVVLVAGLALLGTSPSLQDRRIRYQQERLRDAIFQCHPHRAEKAIKILAGYETPEAVEALLDALGTCLDRLASAQRAYYDAFDKYYEHLFSGHAPEGTDLPTILEQTQKAATAASGSRARLRQIRDALQRALLELPEGLTFDRIARRLSEAREWRARAAAAGLIARTASPGRASVLAARLDREEEPTVVVAVLQGLGKVGKADGTLVKKVGAFVRSEFWSIRFAAVQALRAFGRVEALDVLVPALKAFRGRTRADIRAAIFELSRGLAPGNDERLPEWWEKNRPDLLKGIFRPPGSKANPPTKVVDFFTIPIHSIRLSFLVDASESMKTSARWDPKVLLGRTGKEDRPEGGMKLSIAEFQLRRAFDSLPEGARFALMFYADRVRTFELGPRFLDDDTRRRIAEFMESVEPQGDTDIFFALDRALLYACRRDGRIRKEGLDTIYLLSDGTPTCGLIRTPEELVREVTERNRYAGVAIHTIYVGRPADSDGVRFMRRLAEANHGRAVVATR